MMNDPGIERIDSPQNARIKSAAKLRESRGRKQAGQFLIDGFRENLRAISCDESVETLILCPSLLSSEQLFELQMLASKKRIAQWNVSEEAFAKVTFGQRDDGVIGIAKNRPHELSDLRIPENGLVMVVQAVEKPGNLGAIFRTADAAGVSAVIVSDANVDPKNPNAIRASLGTVFSVPYAMATSQQTIDWLNEKNIKIFATRVDAKMGYSEVDYFANNSAGTQAAGIAIVMGGEALGLSPVWYDPSVIAVNIPMAGIADSLNISVSAAVVLFEIVRQRTNAC